MESLVKAFTMFNNFYRDKKVLVTGNTGFKGSWLTIWLNMLGARVHGISNSVPTVPSMFEKLSMGTSVQHRMIDVRDEPQLTKAILEIQPDVIFHLAAQPIVATSYSDPVGTISTNTIGTVHVLEAARKLKNDCTLVMITSDKCYENVEWLWGYRENDRLGGKDVYSASKAAAEILIYSYYHSFIKHSPNLRLCSVRAGNVIGGGDWADRRLVPDCIRAWVKGEPVVIRNPESTRPWQHVLEPVSGYLVSGYHLAGRKDLNGEAFNFGPPGEQVFSVREVLTAISKHWQWREHQEFLKVEPGTFHEAGLLKLSCEKANVHLKWWPVLNFAETMSFTAKWYWEFYNGDADMLKFTQKQIDEYVGLAKTKALQWTTP